MQQPGRGWSAALLLLLTNSSRTLMPFTATTAELLNLHCSTPGTMSTSCPLCYSAAINTLALPEHSCAQYCIDPNMLSAAAAAAVAPPPFT